jgi:hypothetical protein
MRDGKTVAFLLSFDKSLASGHVRAKCLKDFAPHGWAFEFIDGSYPKILDYPVGRGLFRFLFYILHLMYLKYFKRKKTIALINKPSSIPLILIIRYVIGIKVVSDINDPIHLPQHYGHVKSSLILKLSNHIIFESPEYRDFWKYKNIAPSSVIEDTPQLECVFNNYSQRIRQVIWIGSPNTSEDLLEFIPHFLLFNEYKYNIKILGASIEVINSLLDSKVKLTPIYNYDTKSLIENLTFSAISFVPMPNSDKYNLRGNLKAKISMGCGCLTIATRNRMHERLIVNQKTGFLFSTYADLSEILEYISKDSSVCSKIAYEGNVYVANNFTRANHAQEICRIANTLC